MPLQSLPEFRVPIAPQLARPDFAGILERQRMNRLKEDEQAQLMEMRKQLMARQAAQAENADVANQIALAQNPTIAGIDTSMTPEGTPQITIAGARGEGSPAALQTNAVTPITLPNGEQIFVDPLAKERAVRQAEERKAQNALEDIKAKSEAKIAEDAAKISATPPKSEKQGRFIREKQGTDWVYRDPVTLEEVDRFPINQPAKSSDLKPSERISTFRQIREVYKDTPSTVDFFGKGQQMGSDQLMTRMDSVLKETGGDFSKLSPSAKANFVYAYNKMNDPTSATLQSEFSTIAGRMGLMGKLERFIGKQITGADVTPEVARDLYNVISQVHASQKEKLISDLIERKNELDELDKPLTSLGVPRSLVDEVEKRMGGAQDEMKTDFATEVDAASANLPKGTKITVGGKPAVWE